MASLTSRSATSIDRYRPTILALTALAAGLSIYYLHSSISSSSSTPQTPPLRRSNAIHRRHHHRSQTGDQPPEETPEGSSQSTQRRQRSYGEWRMQLETRGTYVAFDLIYGALPSVDDFVQDYNLGQEDAVQAREDIEIAFLSGFFARSVIPNDEIRAPQRDWIEHQFCNRGFFAESVQEALRRYNDGELNNHPQRALQGGESTADRPQSPPIPRVSQEGQLLEDRSRRAASDVQAIDVEETVADDASEHQRDEEEETFGTAKEAQSLLNLLYNIAEDKARRDGYVHRGVSCNSCGATPVRGIRYRCANCVDHDLCEQCEALRSHSETHVFYKIRIPAPFLGAGQPHPVWYPGRPWAVPAQLPREIGLRLSKETQNEKAEVEALWDQFRCLAATEWIGDPNGFHLAIDRENFDKCFLPTSANRTPPPNILHDQIFAFYDTDGNGLIGFEEFVKGLASLRSKNRDDRIKRIFQGYDINRDGYVSRKDCLRMFRAYYALSKEPSRDLIAGAEDEAAHGRSARDVVLTSLPLSSAFPPLSNNSYPRRRTRAGKILNATGDLVVADDLGVLDENDHDKGDQNEVVGDAAEIAIYGELLDVDPPFWESARPPQNRERVTADTTQRQAGDGPASSNEEAQFDGPESRNPTVSPAALEVHQTWPPNFVTIPEVENALGAYIAIEDVTDPSDRDYICRYAQKRIFEEEIKRRQAMRQRGIDERWRRRKFYIDEENGIEAPRSFGKDGKLEQENGKPRMDYATAQYKAMLEKILGSPLEKPFQVSVEDEILERQFVSGSYPVGAASAVMEIFITMIEDDHSSISMAEELSTGLNGLLELAPGFAEASNFVEWLLRYIKLTDKEMSKASKEPQSEPTPLSRRSRSSSKVRFEDDLTDAELETRSNTSVSSRNIAVGERWGGYEVPQPEKDVGHEVLYQVTQEGVNEMLNSLFKLREDLAMEVLRTKAERTKWRSHILSRIGLHVKTQLEKQIEQYQKHWRLLPSVNIAPPGADDSEPLQGDVFEFVDLVRRQQSGGFTPTSPVSIIPHVKTPSPEYPVPVELHDADRAFNENDTDPEEGATNRPLDELLQESGYTVDPSLSATPEPDNPPSSSDQQGDPTLPQFRPNATIAPETQATGPSRRQIKSTPRSRLAALSEPSASHTILDPPPDLERSQYFVMLDYIERQDEGLRGGPGRLNFEEFMQVMNGPRGPGLAFLTSWIETASF